VLAAGGYPGDYAKGAAINGLDAAANWKAKSSTPVPRSRMASRDGRRSRAVRHRHGRSVDAAQQQAYAWQQNRLEGCFYRKDIGYRAIARERGENQE
jgi:phosphoribosylamine--glycine ligase